MRFCTEKFFFKIAGLVTEVTLFIVYVNWGSLGDDYKAYSLLRCDVVWLVDRY